ncbi:hypothetical protein TREES_T100013405 [Tupaia chinensis]|uniref:Uncharacterized protein n=1 Tax=Tupaia chinensis TaxID=246437 RepID=L9JC27_TUPCH|nr:hypothetical protein TREES_T100013405 [Tupaia chinensis]
MIGLPVRITGRHVSSEGRVGAARLANVSLAPSKRDGHVPIFGNGAPPAGRLSTFYRIRFSERSKISLCELLARLPTRSLAPSKRDGHVPIFGNGAPPAGRLSTFYRIRFSERSKISLCELLARLPTRTEWWDGEHAVEEGMDIVEAIECFGPKNGKSSKIAMATVDNANELGLFPLNHQTLPSAAQESPLRPICSLRPVTCAPSAVSWVPYFPYSPQNLAKLQS